MTADLVLKNGWVVTPEETVRGGVAISNGKFVAIGTDESLPEGKGVTWKSAMTLRARKAGQEFKDARRYGVEVFEDNRTGNLMFISETGAIAVLPK